MKTNLFATGLVALALGACAGSNVPYKGQAIQTKSKLERCYSKPSLCAKSGHENFVSAGEAYSKEDAVNMAKLEVKKQIAGYLFGTSMTSSTTSVRTSQGKSSELPKINNYTETSTQIKVARGTLPRIIWEWECSESINGNKCHVVGYIPR